MLIIDILLIEKKSTFFIYLYPYGRMLPKGNNHVFSHMIHYRIAVLNSDADRSSIKKTFEIGSLVIEFYQMFQKAITLILWVLHGAQLL